MQRETDMEERKQTLLDTDKVILVATLSAWVR